MATTLPALLLEIANLPRAAIAGAGLPAKGALTYHGPPPDEGFDCDDGRVFVWWSTLNTSGVFPSPAALVGCSSPRLIEATIRYTRCWQMEPEYVAAHSTIADQLTVAADVGASSLISCNGADLIEQGLSGKGIALMAVTPRRPMGGVAGVDWRIRFEPRFPAPAE